MGSGGHESSRTSEKGRGGTARTPPGAAVGAHRRRRATASGPPKGGAGRGVPERVGGVSVPRSHSSGGATTHLRGSAQTHAHGGARRLQRPGTHVHVHRVSSTPRAVPALPLDAGRRHERARPYGTGERSGERRGGG